MSAATTKVLSVVGARPQFVKAAAVSRVLRATPGFSEILVHTGQHYDDNMSEVFFREMDIPPAERNLEIGSGSHGVQTGRMLQALEAAMLAERPDWVLVYGDTNSTLAATLAAVKLHVPVAHVEAGLRSFNRAMPEEANRVATDHLADLLFAPTEVAMRNLAREGLAERSLRTGDVMYDVMLRFAERAKRESKVLGRLGVQAGGYVLATIHRAENTDDPARLRAIFEGFAAFSTRVPIVVPLHPRTRKMLAESGFAAPATLKLAEPVGYLDMVELERAARLVATDSGGVQKEAYFQRVPCLTLRTETEWVELVEAGWNRLLAPQSAAAVEDGLISCLQNPLPAWKPLYGDGASATAIVAALRGR
jgi:UDP-GlcNAc3NAcA epimerase